MHTSWLTGTHDHEAPQPSCTTHASPGPQAQTARMAGVARTVTSPAGGGGAAVWITQPTRRSVDSGRTHLGSLGITATA